jgi:hypothetical protein
VHRFLRYAPDRKGGLESELWSGLAASADTGVTNLVNRLGTDPKPWFRDWAAAMYLDDAVGGVVAARCSRASPPPRRPGASP